MEKIKSYILTGLTAIAAAATLGSCSAENPFESEKGTGTLRLHMVVNSTITRADQSADEALRGKCVVYISDMSQKKGETLIHRFEGLENVPAEISMNAGHYVAEAWTGDSVSASFDKKFYRGYQPFDITAGAVNQVVLNCHIANVVVSVNTATIDANLMQTDNYSIKVKNSAGQIEFTPENAACLAYFMMPDGDTTLEYTINGTRKDGKNFTKTGKIENVERAHNYVLNFQYNPNGTTSGDEYGSAFISIKVEDETLTEQTDVHLYGAPSISGVEFDIEKQQLATAGNIADKIVKVCAFGGIRNLIVKNDASSQLGIPAELDMNLSSNLSAYKAAGLSWDYDKAEPYTASAQYKASTNLTTVFVTFSSKLLEKLPASDTEHVITLQVTDTYGKSSEARLRIANTEGAVVVEDPVSVQKVGSDDLMAVGATSVTLTFEIADEIVGTPGIEYREAGGNGDWTFVSVGAGSNAPRRAPLKVGKKYTAKITGLKAGTEYEYRGAARYDDGKEFHGETMSFTTEAKFTIPNASFENWSTYSASTLLGTKTVTLPWNEGNKDASFWGSGNEGSATANMTLTDKTTDMLHSGAYAARLESKSAMGVIAAGNIFVGSYVKTDGTNGVLSMGRPYNGSHPTALRVYANYRPAGGVKVKSGNESYVPAGFSGGTDHAQIYVALTTAPVEIRTNPNDRKLFKEDDSEVLAYGQVSWTSAFGPDGKLEEIKIPLTYKDKAKTTKPTHLVIVCSASKYGDFFSGASGSVMYLDDFELMYE